MKTNISVIIPFLNEEENIPELCMSLDKYAAGKPFSIEVVFVDDGSTDSSVELLTKYPFKTVSAKLIKLSKNYGSHAAIRAGVEKASGEYCMFFSADLQEPVELIGTLYEKINENFDAVMVQKGQVKVSISEKLFSKTYAKLMRKFAVPQFPDGGVNNIMFNQKIRQELNKNKEQNSSIFLQILSMGFKTTIITCNYKERKKGKSKWTLSAKIKLFIDSFVSFSFFPIRLISALGCAMAFFGFIFALIVVIIRIFGIYQLSMGWPTLISILSIGFGITNISLGIIAEYLWRTLDASRNRPLYIIDKEIEL